MKNKLLITILLATTTALSGCVVAPVPAYREPVYVEPPPPRVEYPGYPPIVGHIWIGGFWTWTGHRHEWVPGRWDAPRPGYRWVAPHWEREGNYWRHHEGRWDHDHSPRGNPPPPAPRYESPRSEPMPQYRQERGYQPPLQQAPMPAPPPRREMEPRLPPSQDMGRRGQPEMRTAPPQQQRNSGAEQDERKRGKGDRGDDHGRRRSGDDR